MLDGRTGEALAPAAVWARLAAARVVYVGEHHERRADHRVQLAVLRGLSARGPVALGMEMFDARAQPALDAWVAGSIGEAELLERTAWRERWRMDFGLYRELLREARRRRAPVVALNVPREIVRAVSRGGLDALTPDQRGRIAGELDLDDDAHRAMVREALAEHPGLDEAAGQRFYEAQVVWDESMAEAVARFAAREPARRLVVVAGTMHVERGLGIPRRAARRGAAPFVVVLPAAGGEPSADPARPPADLLWIVGGE